MKKLLIIISVLSCCLALVILSAAPAFACVPGYSPGWYKNHTWPAYDPGANYIATFGLTGEWAPLPGSYLDANPGLTLGGALRLGRSDGYMGGELAFLRLSVATLLNGAGEPYGTGDATEDQFLKSVVQQVYKNRGGAAVFQSDTYGTGWTFSDWADYFDGFFD